MDMILGYFRLLKHELGQMTTQMDAEMASILAILVVVGGWAFLRGNSIRA